jgi:hypothetical protein
VGIQQIFVVSYFKTLSVFRLYTVGLDKVALGQVFSEYFGFPYQFSFHRLLHTHHQLSSGAGTIDQLVADVPSGLSLTPPQKIKKELASNCRKIY